MLLKLKNDLKNIQERSNIYQNNDDDLGLEQENDKLEWEMSRRRVNTLTREYEMLNFTYSGSSILFKEIWALLTKTKTFQPTSLISLQIKYQSYRELFS